MISAKPSLFPTGSTAQPIVFYFGMQNCHYMTENAKKPSPLRVVAAIILGCVVGFILFFIIALGIGFVNDRMAMNIPVNLLFAENIWSAGTSSLC